ncbi:MAG: peptide-methionine (S)-S-oxide reductase MsrA [Nannocystaceae bacterium]|nr:peptide-methionine (S)-S-oxide reductase MsrA [Nannocystaceae bacterium]
MRDLFFRLGLPAVVVAAACSSSSSDAALTVQAPQPAVASAPVEQGDTSIAYFAGGCFWGVEHYLEQMDGVVSVESGYMGGEVDNPTYRQVSSETTGHIETVRVRFDATRIEYAAVAKRFFEIHDPTQANGQGPDVGSQYVSAVFYTGPEQKAATDVLIGKLRSRGYAVVTEVRAAGEFFTAEDYHQDYYGKNGKKPYCHTRVKRFGDD